MTPDQQASFKHHSLLDNEVEMSAPTDPTEQLEYYVNERIQSLIDRDFNRYNLCGRRIVELIEERRLP